MAIDRERVNGHTVIAPKKSVFLFLPARSFAAGECDEVGEFEAAGT